MATTVAMLGGGGGGGGASTILDTMVTTTAGTTTGDWDCDNGDYSGNASVVCGVCDYEDFNNTHRFCDVRPYHLMSANWTPYTETVYGFVSPFLVLITIVTNTLVSVVLLKKNMRTPTNVLLVGMALSDMFTGLLPIPCFIFFYTMGHFHDWVPYEWCFTFDLMFEIVPTICHTASIWLTVALAVQRYIYVCHSLKAKQWCTLANVLKVIAAVYVASVTSQISRFFEFTFTPVVVQSMVEPNATVVSCLRRLTPFVNRNLDLYYLLYYGIRVCAIHLIPCTSLLVLNALLISAMRAAQKRRELLLRQNRRSECRRLKESNCTTLMLVAVVGLFLLVEFPLAILFILLMCENVSGVSLMAESHQSTASLFINLCILLSYPLNFFIYCGMSRQFRETFKRLFTRGAAPPDREHSQYISLATENGGGRTEYVNTSHCTKDTTI